MDLKVGSYTVMIDEESLRKYLESKLGGEVKILDVVKLGEGFHNAGFLLKFKQDSKLKALVMRIVRGDTGWGHDYLSDRASVLLLQHMLYNSAPKNTCIPSIDVVAVMKNGSLASIGEAVEFIQLVEPLTEEYGKPYIEYLLELSRRRNLTRRDEDMCINCVTYLSKMHSEKANNRNLYLRHIRDLIGHGEMLMGVIDTYPGGLDFISDEEVYRIEVEAVKWRNRLKRMTHRLSRIHGDFHPFGNIRFRPDGSIVAVDLSREMYGEPADDVTALTINYLFISIWQYGSLEEAFRRLFKLFYKEYLNRTGDEEILRVVQPFYAFRGMVVVHPIYYPDMKREQRRMLVNFILNVLDEDEFDPDGVDKYLKPI
ncbi:MAG: aminoglycoside phosphotransferase family protein [Candidatus Bathyarchaeia archaeon]